MDGQTDKWANKSPPVFYRTSSPSGPLPCFLSVQFTIMQSRAKGIADHILPLGDLLLFICHRTTLFRVNYKLIIDNENDMFKATQNIFDTLWLSLCPLESDRKRKGWVLDG